MGRLFEKEVLAVEHTYLESIALDTSVIERFLAIEAPVLIIGSGGSYSAAKMVEYLLNRIGTVAKAITPLQLEENQNIIFQSKVILLTARGNNKDILNAFQYCELLETQAILAVCCSTKSKLRKGFIPNGHRYFWENDMDFGKDGYLSVNSLIAMITVMTKAVYRFSGDDFFKLPQTLENCMPENFLEKYDSLKVLGKTTLIVLHGGATTPVAMDMESKFSEAALGNVQLIDYRNFAHGRHYWLSKRTDATGIIAFVDEVQQEIAGKTLDLIPCGIPLHVIQTNYSGMFGILWLYLEVFGIVYSAGKMSGINPGKPQVPDYGKKLYHTSYQYGSFREMKEINKSAVKRAAYRKNGSLLQTKGFWNQYQAAAEKFLYSLQTKDWRCLIFDYDGTLHWKGEISAVEKEIFEYLNFYLQNDCKVAIATGRGKSVREELQKRISSKVWENIAIGYYNGAVCGWLENDNMPQLDRESEPELMELYEELRKDEILKSCFTGWEAPKPKQWSLMLSDCGGKNIAYEILREQVEQKYGLKFVASSHSMDVIGSKTCKRNILGFIQERWDFIDADDCLFIGDAGEMGGNDFEMLCYNGLSVDRVSKNRESCFNLAPLGMRQLDACLYYLKHMKPNKNGSLKLKL